MNCRGPNDLSSSMELVKKIGNSQTVGNSQKHEKHDHWNSFLNSFHKWNLIFTSGTRLKHWDLV